jgi:predicted enzyme related to lactoylglutathione lyase
MASRFTELIVDAVDPERLAAFWGQVLGWERTGRYEGAVELAGRPGSGPSLVFVPVSEPKVAKNRVHIDLNPAGCDQGAELDRLVGLGARHVDIGQGEQTWYVLADPEGNEFCLLRSCVD